MDLSQILAGANVNPTHADQLINDGWTIEHFALMADSIDEFDGAINEVISEEKTMLEKASLRLAWKRCCGISVEEYIQIQLSSRSFAAWEHTQSAFAFYSGASKIQTGLQVGAVEVQIEHGQKWWDYSSQIFQIG